MGASVFQGAVMWSPLPAWQWQSITMGAPQLRSGRFQEPDAGGDSVVDIGQLKFLVGRVNSIVRQRTAHQDRADTQVLLERFHPGNGAKITQKNGRRSEALPVSKRGRAH